jgi:hypothetical protein
MNNSSIANWTTYIWVDAVVVICFVETPNMLLKVWLLQGEGGGDDQIKMSNSAAVKALYVCLSRYVVALCAHRTVTIGYSSFDSTTLDWPM